MRPYFPCLGLVAATVIACSASTALDEDDQQALEGDAQAAPFAACSTAADCLAVPKADCCHLGWKAAVNRSQVDAYQQSFHCPEPNPICIKLLIIDRREPVCDFETRRCVLAPNTSASK